MYFCSMYYFYIRTKSIKHNISKAVIITINPEIILFICILKKWNYMYCLRHAVIIVIT